MPKKPLVSRDDLDRFYTADDIAVQCTKLAVKYLKTVDLIVEPSAGGGAFLRALDVVLPDKSYVAYDIAPQCPRVQEADWFTVVLDGGSVAILGNPPFGSRNALSIKFIQHALSFDSVKVVAFILPAVWGKPTLQKTFPKNWTLVVSKKLPNDSFVIDGETYHVPTVFQVWLKDSKARNLRWEDNPEIETDDFFFTLPEKADFFILGAAPSTTIDPKSVKPTQRGYYVKAKRRLTTTRKRFEELPWQEYGLSSVNGGVFWMTKAEIVRAWVAQDK